MRPGPETTLLPFRGAGSTVSAIQTAALRAQTDYSVRTLAERICQGIRSKDYLSEALAIFHFVCARTRYMRDPVHLEMVRAPQLVVADILRGRVPSLDCDDMVALICALLLASGCRCAIVTVAFRHMHYQGERQYSHVYIVAIEPRTGARVALDPVAGPKTQEMLSRVVAAKVWPL